jgi:hypothetical protein
MMTTKIGKLPVTCGIFTNYNCYWLANLHYHVTIDLSRGTV